MRLRFPVVVYVVAHSGGYVSFFMCREAAYAFARRHGDVPADVIMRYVQDDGRTARKGKAKKGGAS